MVPVRPMTLLLCERRRLFFLFKYRILNLDLGRRFTSGWLTTIKTYSSVSSWVISFQWGCRVILTWRADLHLEIDVNVLPIKSGDQGAATSLLLRLFLTIAIFVLGAFWLSAVSLCADLTLVGLAVRAGILIIVKAELVIDIATRAFATACCLAHLIMWINIINSWNS